MNLNQFGISSLARLQRKQYTYLCTHVCTCLAMLCYAFANLFLAKKAIALPARLPNQLLTCSFMPQLLRTSRRHNQSGLFLSLRRTATATATAAAGFTFNAT